MKRLGRPSTQKILLGTLLLSVLALTAWINLPAVSRVFDQSADREAALPAASPFRAGQRVLALSPHPDDETLCCAGMIQQAQAAGAQVFIAWATAGDGFEFDAILTQKVLDPGPQHMQRLGNLRVREALTPGAPYTGLALETDLTRVLDRVRPDLVLAPAPQDFHSDHHTLSYIAMRLMSARGQEDRLSF